MPSQLPAPTLSGSVGTYKNVEPGVDLRLQALTDGYDLDRTATVWRGVFGCPSC